MAEPEVAMAAEQRWDENFEAVQGFREERGRWPIEKRDGALGRWCKTQREAKKGKGTYRISPARIARLDGIGFDWGTTMTGSPEERWEREL